MFEKIEYIGNGKNYDLKGSVHIAGPISDYTICGITLDHDLNTAGDYKGTQKKVNCRHCIEIIRLCKTIPDKELEY